MALHLCYSASETPFPYRDTSRAHGPFGFPAPADSRRPYICCSKFRDGLDGRASFRELKGDNDGRLCHGAEKMPGYMDFCEPTMMHN